MEKNLRRVIYLLSHPAHAPYAVVSINSLRKHWQGIVHLYSWKESWKIAQQIAADPRLDVWALLREPDYRGHCDQFMDKIKLVQGMDTDDAVLYLDADTTVHGWIDPLFDAAETHGFAATQFGDWTTQTRKIQGRLAELGAYPVIDKDLLAYTLAATLPSVNGGVWAAKPASPVLTPWYEWSMAVKGLFIADERILHLMATRYCATSDMRVLDCRWNCSPVYQPDSIADADVRIRHYHGDSNVRPEKSPKGHAIWWPLYQEALRLDLGGIRSWHGSTGNRFLSQLESAGRKQEALP
jgi:hypothetical protein